MRKSLLSTHFKSTTTVFDKETFSLTIVLLEHIRVSIFKISSKTLSLNVMTLQTVIFDISSRHFTLSLPVDGIATVFCCQQGRESEFHEHCSRIQLPDSHVFKGTSELVEGFMQSVISSN